jgi:glycosyltransferase involved in cell wall biosynthesis
MFVTNSLTGGGAERATNILINALTDSGARVSLVTVNSSEVDAVTPRCEVFELLRPWQGGIGSLLAAFLRFRTFVQQWSPDIIVLNCDAPELFGALLLGKHITVVVEHSSKPWGTRRYLGRVVRIILKFRNSKWVAVSSHLGIWPSNRRPDVWISNPVLENLDRVQTATREKEIKFDHELRRLVYIGRLSVEKQPGWVLEIAKQTGLPAILFGDGRLRESLSEESSLRGIAAQFPGFVRDPWIFIEDGDLLIIPSAFEGDGLVLIESLAKRVPLLVNAIPDLLRFDLPIHNYCKSPNQFVQRISTFSQKHTDLCVPDDVSLRILQQRLPKEIAARWMEFLTNLK